MVVVVVVVVDVVEVVVVELVVVVDVDVVVDVVVEVTLGPRVSDANQKKYEITNHYYHTGYSERY